MKYRAEIDGLRALAVLPVIFFHAGFSLFSGGFVGVDVFFVISGYLITSIILAEQEKGTFSIAHFYERRARRILPALFLVIITCLPFAYVWMLPEDFISFGKSIVAVQLFASNFFYFFESGYFEGASELKPLLHTWSLAVEEQFYLIFPAFIAFTWWVGRKKIIFIIGLVAMLSLLLSQFGGLYSFTSGTLDEARLFAVPSYAFFLDPTRAWEHLIGVLAAFYLQSNGQPKLSYNWVLALLGLLLVAIATVVFDKNTPFPSVFALVPTIGTLLIILYATSDNLVGKFLSLPLIVGVGLISYSSYLWHQPIFVFARLRSADQLETWLLLTLSLFALLLGYLSWRYVEKPFRNKSNFSRGQIFTYSIAGSVVLVGVGLVAAYSNIAYSRFDDKTLEVIESNSHLQSAGWGKCSSDSNASFTSDCALGANVAPTIALLGDSHAEALAFEIGLRLKDENLSVQNLTFFACPPVPNIIIKETYDLRCPKYNDRVWEYLKHSQQIETVIIHASWLAYFEGTLFDNGEGGVEHGQNRTAITIDNDNWVESDEARKALVGEYIKNSVQVLLDQGKRVIFVYPSPEIGWDVPNMIIKSSLFRWEDREDISISYDSFLRRSKDTYYALSQIPDHANLSRVLLSETLCNKVMEGRCSATMNGRPLYFDDNHLSNLGSKLAVIDIMSEIQ